MKLWFWLFLLLNIGLLAYFNMDKIITPQQKVMEEEVNPEQIKLLAEDDFSDLKKKEAPAVVATSCYKWGSFTESNMSEAQAVMQRLGIDAEFIQESSTAKEDDRYWVYYPPLATAQLAQRKADEIKRLGVKDLYIVQGKRWRNAISFGLFAEQPLAKALLKELKSKGVRNAVISLRKQGKLTGSLLAKAVTSDVAVELYKVRPEFVGTDVVPVRCP